MLIESKQALKFLLEALRDSRYMGQKLQPKQAEYLLDLLKADLEKYKSRPSDEMENIVG
jgi:hypothetical protein